MLILLILLQNCSKKEQLPYYPFADLTPYWTSDGTIDPDTVSSIRDFRLLNQDSIVISSSRTKGKVYVANFFFTICPGICPKLTSNLKLVAEAKSDLDDFRIISHSVTPELDSVPSLKEYEKEYELAGYNWDLVTGDRDEIYDLAFNSYFTEQEVNTNPTENTFLHTEKVILVDREGKIRGIYNGTLELDMKRLIEDIDLIY